MSGDWPITPSDAGIIMPDPSPEIGWCEVIRIWYRAAWILLPVAFVGGILAVVVSLAFEPAYEAGAVLLLDRPSPGRLDNAADTPESSAQERETIARSQISMAAGDEVVAGVIDELHLATQSIFNPVPSLASRLLGEVNATFNFVRSSHEDMSPAAARTRIIRAYLGRLVVVQDPNTYILHISFRAPDPVLAERIANAHVAHYITWLKGRQEQAINGAQVWLVSAVASSHSRLLAAEAAVQEFNKSGVMFNVEGRTALDQGLAQLTSDLAVAQATVVKQQARADEIRRLQKAGQSGSVAAISDSKLLTELEAARAQTNANNAAVQSNFSAQYPGVVQSQARDNVLRAAIAGEIDRIIDGALSQASVARVTVDNLTVALDRMKQQVVVAESGRAKLLRLEGEADTDRKIYLALLQKLRSYDTVSELARANVTVVSPATAPDLPRSPRRGLFAAFGFLLAGGAAAGVSVWRINRRDVVRHTTDASGLTGVRCLGVMPRLKLRGRQFDRDQANYSFFREELRSICATLARDQNGERSKSVSLLVTSSLPQEGKSSFCHELGRFAAESGVRTLIVRADVAGGTSRCGVGDPVPITLEAGLPLFGVEWRLPGTLLGNPEVGQLLDTWRHEFRLVVIDTPPLSAMAGGVIVAPLVDTAIVLARVDQTPRSLLASVTGQIERAGGRLAGLVVTFALLDGHRGMMPSDFGYYFRQNRAYHSRLTAARATERA